ncbi:tyrosine--tRNA ligase [Haloglycomyces albus]|uniref:tyrosine--tRNA ligase n=1 Tax=Haloglycomyces albus TaxID=526067 RepID=UPI00046CC6DB|nr:tyrosine--tRNA ligase [Haloglycomyces albus]
MSRLYQSVQKAQKLLRSANLDTPQIAAELLELSHYRRDLDLSDLTPTEQAALISNRSVQILPSDDDLSARIAAAGESGITVKFGIDPTGAEIHLGHAVPMIVLSRFQRMGHNIVFIVGDITASIGDPSGRSDERPALTAEDIANNLASYQDQVSPFFDFSQAQFRKNSEWLADIKLPELLGTLSHIPTSMSLQREDFRNRLDAGHGLALSEFIYSVVMAIDSQKITADVELGGMDQLLNMQMGRKVMEISGQAPQLVVAMPLIEGTDGTGTKMSKSKDNYIPLTLAASDTFGRIMSIPDRLTLPYMRAWTEWTEPEIEDFEEACTEGRLHPMSLKKLLAADVVAVMHGKSAAIEARREFESRFSRRRFAALNDIPVINLTEHTDSSLSHLLVDVLAFASSKGEVRRIAKGGGLKIVWETNSDQQTDRLTERQINNSLTSIVKPPEEDSEAVAYVKMGRRLARITT